MAVINGANGVETGTRADASNLGGILVSGGAKPIKDGTDLMSDIQQGVNLKAILKELSNDFYDIEGYCPDDKECFSLSLLLRIGIEDSNGADNFDLFICTPEWLSKHQWEPELIRHTLLVRKYNLDEITKIITDYIDQCEGNDWIEIAQKLSRFFAWEYEDYQC